MRKLYVFLIVSIILFAVLTAGYILFSSGDASPSHFDDPHFTVRTVSSQPAFSGERVIVRATVRNDEPGQETAVPTTTIMTITPNPDDTKGKATVTAMPTTIIRIISATGSHVVTARISGDQGIDITRVVNVSLDSNQSKDISFDFGLIPAGSYTLSVTAPSYNNSTMSRAVRVYPAPVFGDWTEIGDVAFMLVNLQHDSVDLIIRNNGGRLVAFNDSPYLIFVNCSGGYGTILHGLEETKVMPGKTITAHANITVPGSYYLDYFAIKAPDRTSLVKVPVKAQIGATV